MGARRYSCGSRICDSIAMLRRWIPLVFVLAVTAVGLTMGRKESSAQKDIAADSVQHVKGISGRVEIWEGNFMPVIAPGKIGGTITAGANRRVRAHEPVKLSPGGLAQTRRDTVLTALIAETVSDSTGHFFMNVPPGTYSVFVEENGGWYYNGWNGDGVQGGVTVLPDSTSDIIIKITTKATY
jgi:hypothetical protein